MSNFHCKFILQGEGGHQILRETCPFVLNLGTQFENVGRTFEVHRIVKEEGTEPWVLFYCRQLNATPWLTEHIEKSIYLVMSKGKGVNA